MKDLRRDYVIGALDESTLDSNPLGQFKVWFDEAAKAELLDVNAMSLATASAAGEPAVRTVLLKEVDDRGFIFYTHYNSAKGRDLAENPRASLLFFWAPFERQIRITGVVTRVPREMSVAYFATRPLDSQWAAAAATQSTEIASREALERAFADVKRKYENQPVPCPPDWGGFHVEAERMEFWQGRPSRLHDRIRYIKQPSGVWTRARLAP